MTTHQTTKTIIVNVSCSEAYQLWSNFENFPNFMKNINSVQKTGPNTSHWKMSGPLGYQVEWDAETTMMEKNSRIGWNSRDNGDITTSGQVTFNELGTNQTEITVTLQYVPPAGLAGEIVAQLFSNPEKQLEEDLQNFKHYAEGSNQRTA